MDLNKLTDKYSLLVCDTETTGLDPIKNDVIELSLYRISDNSQKTWCIKPLHPENIDQAALRINGHKIEDLTHKTEFGRATYLDSNTAIVQIENWLLSDNATAAQRVLVGANTNFDKEMLEQLWIKCNSADSLPFGRRYLDVQQIEFFLNLCQEGNMLDSYSLSSILKKYSIKNSKSHTAAADTVAAKEVFEKQVEVFTKLLRQKTNK